MVKLMEGNMLR